MKRKHQKRELYFLLRIEDLGTRRQTMNQLRERMITNTYPCCPGVARFKVLHDVYMQSYDKTCPSCGFKWTVERVAIMKGDVIIVDKLVWMSTDYKYGEGEPDVTEWQLGERAAERGEPRDPGRSGEWLDGWDYVASRATIENAQGWIQHDAKRLRLA